MREVCQRSVLGLAGFAVAFTQHEKPVAGTHWSIRKMTRATDLSYTSVQRIWKAHEFKPHLVKTFKLSNDKRFVER